LSSTNSVRSPIHVISVPTLRYYPLIRNALKTIWNFINDLISTYFIIPSK
jgi:hypothetical protein